MDRIERIRNFIKNADLSRPEHRAAIGRGLVVVWNNQTESEQNSKDTTLRNGEGFNGRDARFGSVLAEWFADKGFLSVRQAEMGRKMLAKYARQIAEATQPANA
jgi:hypothetical protein